MGLSKLKNTAPDRDKIIVIDANGTADIATVFDRDSESLFAESATEDYAVPIADVTAFVGTQGRIYMLRADSDYIADTKRLASLEKSIVLRQVTHFQRPQDDAASGINIKAILLYALVGILLLAVIFK